jgi:hypothetical protein
MIGAVVEMLFLGIGIPALLATAILFATLRRTRALPEPKPQPVEQPPRIRERHRTDER